MHAFGIDDCARIKKKLNSLFGSKGRGSMKRRFTFRSAGENDTGPARKVIATFRAELDSLPADAPRRSVLHRLSTQLDAMVAHHEGNTGRAIALLQELAPKDPNNASLPPSTIPTFELLGDYLLAAGRKAEAADAYQKALELRPNRFLAKRGLEVARQ